MLSSVNHENDTVEGTAVVGPSLTGLVVSTQVVCVESNVADGHLGLMGVQRGVRLCETVRLQHVEHGGLAGVIKSEEDDIGTLLEEAHPFHGSLKEVHNEHGFCCVVFLT